MFHNLLVKLSITLMLWTCGVAMAQAPGGKMPASSVLVEKVGSKVPTTLKKYTGMFEAINKVMSIARVSGNIVKAPFQEGDLIQKGDLLFEIEDTVYAANVAAAEAKIASSQAAIKQAEARIDQIKAAVQYAQTSYDRDEQLFKAGRAVSEDTLESRRSTLDGAKAQLVAANAELLSAKAALQAADASLVLAKFDLSHTKIYSEITGRAGRLTYSVGNYVTPASNALITVTQLDPIYIQFSMSETDFVSMFGNVETLKKTVSMQVILADGSVYDQAGEIKFIDNAVKTSTDTIRIWAEFPNPAERLNPGGIARVELQKMGEKPLPQVKNSAVLHTAQGTAVYIVKGNKAELRPVKLGPADNEYQTVLEGIEDGEVVVIGGTHKIMPGGEIKPVYKGDETKEAALVGAHMDAMFSGKAPAAPAQTPAQTPAKAPKAEEKAPAAKGASK